MEYNIQITDYARASSKCALCIALILAMLITPVLAGDPSGSDTLKEDPDAAVNFTWTLIAGFLVMFMQAGFAMLTAGLVRVKNTANVLMKNLMDFMAGSLTYWAIGFGFMFGVSAYGIIGTSGFFLAGDSYDVSTAMLWFFQMVFAATAATIVAGTLAERLKFKAYIIYSVALTAIIYPIYGHWLWGGGWLSELGALDFAGSGVVHGIGGYVALAGAIILGPRIGKFNSDGTPNAIPGHNLSMVVLGTFILFFGWFGFNPGSTLAATDLRIAIVAVNTALAAAAGAVTVMLITWFKSGKPDVSMTCNGCLAGLVSITAPCAWVAPWAAVIIGIVGGIIAIIGVWLLDWILKVDDPVGAIFVHGFSGSWGLLAVGIFADGTYNDVSGLLYGNSAQFLAQVISVVVNFAWAFGLGLILFTILKYTIGIRVSPEEELQGLDIGEHGISAYPVAR
ncbi:MAG: ammonium transporter [Methanosarcinales archaeon]